MFYKRSQSEINKSKQSKYALKFEKLITSICIDKPNSLDGKCEYFPIHPL